MWKILKSSFVILLVAAAVGGGTYSLFSDTETSAGNTFTAGALDLKVDSESHYNGLVCTPGTDGNTWQLPGACAPTGTDLVSNGSFENPEVTDPQKWQIFESGLSWNVEWVTPGVPTEKPASAKLELHRGVLGNAAEGQQYAELDSDWFGSSNPQSGEPASVRIKQDIATVSGKKYRLSFQFAPRPNTAASDNVLEVRAGGSLLDTLSGAGGSGIVWTPHTYEFTATGSSTEISFADLGTENSLGTFLDDVDVHELSCPTSATSELIGKPCSGTWSLTNLENGVHKFFNFDDVKPGDVGEDTVSLHVYDNDAWGRMNVIVTKDADNTCTSSEQIAEDGDCETPGVGLGDLRKNLNFSIWLDEGTTPGFQGKGTDSGEGDNVKQDGEIELVAPGEIDASGETHDIWEGLSAAYVAHGCAVADGHTNYTLCHGLAADGRMVASATYYFGIGWDLPLETGNEAQTDEFVGDISFEIEQYRNNPVPFTTP
jgi:predicted ribosomally synthesized peptide with SipW-like signal peptide